jgi:hypothetical protein
MDVQEPEPGEVYWQAIEPIWDSIGIYAGPQEFLQGYERVDPALGHLLAVHLCTFEVTNGGLHQYFHNSTGVLAPEAVVGFRAIGLPECAALVEEAMAFFGDPYPREQEARIARLDTYTAQHASSELWERLWDPFDALTDRFYEELPFGEERLERAADEYARRHTG